LQPERLDIAIPEFPPTIGWINARMVHLGTLLGRGAILVWFWDSSSLNSLRALPYVQEWDRRYREAGLRTFGVHSPQFDYGRDREHVVRAVERLGIEFPVAPDPDYEVWRAYGNEVWPALYLWDRRGILRWYHFAEGAYDETEATIQDLLREAGAQVEFPSPMGPLRDTDAPGALVAPPTPHSYLEDDRGPRPVQAGEQLHIRYSGAGAAAVLDGIGDVDVVVDGRRVRTIALDGPGLYEVADHDEHGEHELALEFRCDARAYAFSFAPGLARNGLTRSDEG
jgi:hypothetical protein